MTTHIYYNARLTFITSWIANAKKKNLSIFICSHVIVGEMYNEKVFFD